MTQLIWGALFVLALLVYVCGWPLLLGALLWSWDWRAWRRNRALFALLAWVEHKPECMSREPLPPQRPCTCDLSAIRASVGVEDRIIHDPS